MRIRAIAATVVGDYFVGFGGVKRNANIARMGWAGMWIQNRSPFPDWR